MNPELQDRRSSPRVSASRPCKVFHGASGAYLNGRTRDFSVGGALVEVDPSPHVRAGDEITLFIAWGPRGLLDDREGVPARVAHVMRGQGPALVGIAFDETQRGAGAQVKAAA
jgi:hypothetical protein